MPGILEAHANSDVMDLDDYEADSGSDLVPGFIEEHEGAVVVTKADFETGLQRFAILDADPHAEHTDFASSPNSPLPDLMSSSAHSPGAKSTSPSTQKDAEP